MGSSLSAHAAEFFPSDRTRLDVGLGGPGPPVGAYVNAMLSLMNSRLLHLEQKAEAGDEMKEINLEMDRLVARLVTLETKFEEAECGMKESGSEVDEHLSDPTRLGELPARLGAIEDKVTTLET